MTRLPQETYLGVSVYFYCQNLLSILTLRHLDFTLVAFVSYITKWINIKQQQNKLPVCDSANNETEFTGLYVLDH